MEGNSTSDVDETKKVYTFTIRAQSHKDGQFSIPAEICRKLKVKHEDYVYLVVKDSSSGEILVDKIKQIKSGTEIYGKDMETITRGSLIEVQVSRTKVDADNK